MSKRTFLVTIEVLVEDKAKLRSAAAARAQADGLDASDWESTRAGPTDDLIMLLDPGSLVGCSIIESHCEEV
jgi:hypothetical protein